MRPKKAIAFLALFGCSTMAVADKYGIDEAMRDDGVGHVSGTAWAILLIGIFVFYWVTTRGDTQRPKPKKTEPGEADDEDPPSAPAKKSGSPWLPIIVGVVLAKLISPIGALIFMGIYAWLRPRIGLAKTIATVCVVMAAFVAVAVFIPTQALKPAPASVVSANPPTDWEKGSIAPPIPAPAPQTSPSAAPVPASPQAPYPNPANGEQEAIRKHYQRILSAHPDAFTVADSKEFKDWISFRPVDQHILENGTTQEIIDMLSQFKHRNDCAPPNPLPECRSVTARQP